MTIQQMLLGGSGESGYNLTRSLRFRASASAYLNRTPAGAGNRKTWTWSAWVKRGTLGSNQVLFISKPSGGTDATFTTIGFSSSDTLLVSGLSVQWKNTTQVFRDPSAWYHIVITWDTTQATASNRVRVYVNGSQVTAFGTTFDPSLNFDGAINQADVHALCRADGYSASYFDGYLTEVNFIDGQALTPSSFGSTNALTGVWQPAAYSGSYGTNGFYLPFTDNSALTTSSNVGLGKDFSGNGNYWTTNNISITAGQTYDSMTDVPTLTGATTSNFPVLNRILPAAGSPDIRDANLYLRCADPSNFTAIPATMLLPTTGKWYSEFTAVYVDGATSPLDIGLLGSTDFPTPSGVIGASATSYAYRNNGNKLNNSVTTAYGASYVIGDIIAIAFDATAGTLTFYKNNVSQGVAFTGLTAQYFFAVGGYNFGQWAANFGQRPFAYTPPTGFVALNTFNLPTATILKGNTVMDATLYTGNGSTQTITNAAGFRPDFVWVKTRSSGSFGHALFDSVRGAPRRLASNLTEAENTTGSFGQVSSFNSNGFTVATGSSSFGETGLNALTYVGWQWQAGQGSSSSNTAGSITSTVSVNASAGFSVVTFNIGSSVPPATVGHGLGVAPKLIIAKDRTTAGGWPVFHASATNQNQYLVLNGTGAVASATNVWGSSLPTSSVFGVTAGITLGANSNCVAYCWSEIDGFSKFGSYVGNSNADGPFIYCGFRPKFVMFKGSSFDNNWYIIDSTTNTINVAGTGLKPNASDSEIANSTTQNAVDFLSNGFKLRNNAAAVAFNNSSGQTFIYAAFAENPFRNSLAR